MGASLKDYFVPAVASAVIIALLGWAFQEMSKPFVSIDVQTLSAMNSTSVSRVWLSNYGGSTAHELEIHILSNAEEIHVIPRTLNENVVIEPSNSQPGTVLVKVPRLIYDQGIILEVELDSLKSIQGYQLLVSASYEEGSAMESYLLTEMDVERTSPTPKQLPMRLIFNQEIPWILLWVGAMGALYFVLVQPASMRAMAQLNIFTALNRERYVARSIIREANSVKKRLTDDILYVGKLLWPFWFSIPHRTRRVLFTNDVEYGVIDEFYTKLKIREFNITNGKIDGDALRKINLECLHLANQLLSTGSLEKYVKKRSS